MVVLKNKTEGRHLWVRTISSTVVGQGVDSVLFFSIAFGISGLWPWPAVFAAMIFAWLAKSIYEGTGDASDLPGGELAEAHGADGHL